MSNGRNFRPAPIYRDMEQLASAVQELRRQGGSIVLSNGCFDFLHVGHIRYLMGAADQGDHLLVAINSDASVRGLKGDTRPLVPQEERAEIISTLGFVDLVYIFDEPDVRGIIRAIRPDVHAKGTDYTEESVPEGDLVREMGGRVAIVGDPKDHDSREMIRKLGGAGK